MDHAPIYIIHSGEWWVGRMDIGCNTDGWAYALYIGDSWAETLGIEGDGWTGVSYLT